MEGEIADFVEDEFILRIFFFSARAQLCCYGRAGQGCPQMLAFFGFPNGMTNLARLVFF